MVGTGQALQEPTCAAGNAASIMFSAIHAAGFGVEGGQIKWMLPGAIFMLTTALAQQYLSLKTAHEHHSNPPVNSLL